MVQGVARLLRAQMPNPCLQAIRGVKCPSDPRNYQRSAERCSALGLGLLQPDACGEASHEETPATASAHC